MINILIKALTTKVQRGLLKRNFSYMVGRRAEMESTDSESSDDPNFSFEIQKPENASFYKLLRKKYAHGKAGDMGDPEKMASVEDIVVPVNETVQQLSVQNLLNADTSQDGTTVIELTDQKAPNKEPTGGQVPDSAQVNTN